MLASPCVPARPLSRLRSPGKCRRSWNSQKGSGGGELWPRPGAWRRPRLLGGLPTGLAGSPVAAGASVLGRANCRPGVMCAGRQHVYICWGWQCRWEACVRVRVGCVQTLTESRVTITLGAYASFSTMATIDVKERARAGYLTWSDLLNASLVIRHGETRAVAPGPARWRVCTRVLGKITHRYNGAERKWVCRGRTEERVPLIVFLPSCLNFVRHVY